MTANGPDLSASTCPLIEFCVRAHGCKQYGDQIGHELLQEDQHDQWHALVHTNVIIDGTAVSLLRTHECFGHCDDDAAAVVTIGEHQALIAFFTIDEFRAELQKVLAYTSVDWEKRRPRAEAEIKEIIRRWEAEAEAEFRELLKDAPKNSMT